MMFKSLDPVLFNTGSPERAMPKFTSVEYTLYTLLVKMKSVNTLSDNEIQGIIYRQYNMLLDYDLFLVNPESKKAAQEMFTNTNFLRNLGYCVTNLILTDHQKICLNKLAFDYISLDTTEQNPIIKDQLMDISYKVNLKDVLPLTSIIGLENAKYITMLRLSSFNEEINISRVNRFIIKGGLELREQQILEIYGYLFDRVSILFSTTMLELPEDTYDKLMRYRYDEISKVMIDILDNMTSENIKITLRNYGSTYELKGNPPVRFTLRTIHYSFARILNVINELMDEEGIYVP